MLAALHPLTSCKYLMTLAETCTEVVCEIVCKQDSSLSTGGMHTWTVHDLHIPDIDICHSMCEKLQQCWWVTPLCWAWQGGSGVWHAGGARAGDAHTHRLPAARGGAVQPRRAPLPVRPPPCVGQHRWHCLGLLLHRNRACVSAL